MNEIYPKHAADLESAHLTAPKKYLTLRQSLDQLKVPPNRKIVKKTKKTTEAEAKRERDKARCTWFCVGYSKIWGIPISKRLTRLRDKYKLSWPCIFMSYS